MGNEPIRKPGGAARVGWVAVAAMAAAIVVLAVAKKPKQNVEASPEKSLAVRTWVVQPRPAVDVLRIPGQIEASEHARVAVEKPGRVVELPVDEGDPVRKGQVMLAVDSRIWDATRRQAEIEKRQAERDLARWRELEKTGAVSASDFDQIQRRMDLAEVAMTQAVVAASQCRVRSPIDGVVDARFIEEGEYANEGQAVFRVVNADIVKVSFDVPERDVGTVRTNRLVAFTVGTTDPVAFTGRVTFVSVAANRENNAFRAELTLPNPEQRLRPGMIADVFLSRAARPAAAVVPLAAVVPRKGEHFAFVVKDGRAVRRRVRIDAIFGQDAALADGIQPGDELVVEGQRTLQDGVSVSVETAP
jgi:membrane fusion protein (multidrug efflux system)